MTPPLFISGDWGTSRLRLRLVRAEPFAIEAEAASDDGIARVFADWQGAGRPADREGFYFRRLLPVLDALRADSGVDPAGLPLVLSGMASATIGPREIRYASCPLPLSGEGLFVARIAPGVLPGPAVLVSGVSDEADVMRGEETILMGLAALGLGDGLYILPGTHSKHVDVTGGEIVGFRTYLTGELFALLRDHSVLKPCLAEPDEEHGRAFVAGVRDATSTNLLHELFALRARSVLGDASAEENGARLSGLLIGHELADLAEMPDDRTIYLAAAGPLETLYQIALDQVGLRGRIHGACETGLAIAMGQAAILDRLDDLPDAS